jgi:glycosyltransferase involved in cell wall biosynthesis
MSPSVSVTMAVYDALPYLAPAIESILAQTHADFELIAVDDGSRDGSLAILERFAALDPRVRVIRRAHGGLVPTRNAALAEARGEFVAVMDADDLALPERLARQVAYLRAHPGVLVVGAEVEIIDPDGWPIRKGGVPLEHDAIEAALMAGRGEAITHPVATFRREALLAAGGYREGIPHAEDLDLYLRLAERGRLANLPETLLRYRHHLRKTSNACAGDHRRVTNQVLRDARRRRGLDLAGGFELPALSSDTPAVDYWCEWVRQAVIGGNLATARKYALAVLRREPVRLRSWQLLARALLGIRVEPLKRWLARGHAPATPARR